MSDTPTWGLVSTIKAPADAILNFAAHHLELGAHRLHIYLDEDCPDARRALAANPRCRVTVTDAAYWAKRSRARPDAHQPRQTANATHAYRRQPQVDWLAHIDVDEFLWPTGAASISAQLARLPADALTARVRPIEALGAVDDDSATWFKACHPRQTRRNAQTGEIYPTFGLLLNGGFLSHVTGKIFVRTGLDGVGLRIHNAFRDGSRIPNDHDLPAQLCHFHAPSWQAWQRAYRYRLHSGSYRPDLKGAPSIPTTMNELFHAIEAEGGETALRAFYDEVCTATPALRARLEVHGLLHRIDLDLDAKRARHFPDPA